MRNLLLRTLAGATALGLGAVTTAPALASEMTDILDPFARSADAGLDFGLKVGWDMLHRGGDIRREFRCLSHDSQVGGLCPDGSTIIDVDELTTERVIHRLNVDATLAFWRYAQLHARLPLVLSDRTTLGFADGVYPGNSTVDPEDRPSLFNLPFTGEKRTGLADPIVGVRFAPMSWTRDFTRPTWAIGLDLTLPFASVKEADNTAVGEGVFAVEISSAVSSRFTDYLQPYFKVAGKLNIPTAKSLFDDYGKTQTLVGPGHELGITLGSEIIPFEDHGDERTFVFDLGGSVRFKFEGREYTDLFEALGTSKCDPRDTSEPCDLTTFTRGDIDPATGRRRKSDGITDVENYATFTGWFGLRYQMIKHLELTTRFTVGYETPHFLTAADAGKDLDGRNQVEPVNSNGENEFSPVYNENYDAIGTRFRTANTMLYGLTVSLMGKF